MMEIEAFSAKNIKHLTELALELWTDGDFEEELNYYKNLLGSESDICYLAKAQDNYIGFIHLSIRNEYVEGGTDFPIAYIEGLYVKPNYQNLGIGKKLAKMGEDWGRKKGCKQAASDAELDNWASINFHKKIGFEEVNRVVCFVKEL
jgi:aminoglycoside 6'-N-acetyltransferase I